MCCTKEVTVSGADGAKVKVIGAKAVGVPNNYPGERVGDSDLVRQIYELPDSQRLEVLSELVRAEIARALRLAVADVSLTTPLADMGMDSLMMLELRTVIEEAVQCHA